ncbi:hypothetical protein BGZ58_008497 [Dissophora ornata]|nr:hypothetical protein BGZ58_008497 [Dissophora ornata]
MKILEKDIPKLRIFILLTRLRKVVLQDAAVLMALRNPEFRNSEHHIFREQVFGSALFLEFQVQLLQSVETSKSPVSDSLAANAPAINHEFRSLHMRDEQRNRQPNQLLKLVLDSREEQKDEVRGATGGINSRIDDRFSALVSFAYDLSVAYCACTHQIDGDPAS